MSSLLCDTCGAPIQDINFAMVYFRHSARKATGLRLGHKGRCDPDTEDSSVELGWLAEDGLFQLARLASDYDWEAADLKRLIAITWALNGDGLGETMMERIIMRHG